MRTIHDSRYIHIIKQLVVLRERKNISQVQLALSLKKPQSYVSKVENLDRRLDIIELKDWLACLDTDLFVFLMDSLDV